MTPFELTELYTALSMVSIPRGAPRTHLDHSLESTCRYCGKAAPEATFRTDAHVIPELLGNRALLASDECDDCNAFFAATLEDSLGKFLGPGRTLTQLPGKSGVPTHKESDHSVVIRLEPTGLEIRAATSANAVTIDEAADRISLRLARQAYTPIAVYKAIVKMAIGLLPPSELTHFQDTIAWLREPANAHTNPIASPLNLAMAFVQGIYPTPGVVAFVFRRQARQAEVPYCLFFMSAFNYLFQAVVPCRRKDAHLLGKSISLTVFPTPFDEAWPSGPPRWEILDCSATTQVRGGSFTYTMQCGKLIDVTPTQG